MTRPSTGFTYQINNFSYSLDSEGKPIVSRLALSFGVRADHISSIEPFDRRANVTAISMVSEDGRHFTLDRSASPQSAQMRYNYSYDQNSPESLILAFYKDSFCNPIVSGEALSMGVRNAELTFTEPDTTHQGQASIKIELDGNTSVRTNFGTKCNASRTFPDGTTVHYGHKNIVNGPGSVSVSMNVNAQFENRFY